MDAIAKKDGNQSVMDLKEQVELLQKLLEVVKVSGDEGELNKCMNQIMNLKDKYSELMGGLDIYESPNKSMTKDSERRRIEDSDNGEDTITGDGSPRLSGVGSMVTMMEC